MKKLFLLLAIAYVLLFSSCNPHPGNIHDQKFFIGQTVKLHDIKLPGTGYVPPLTITYVYWDADFEQFTYDATDGRGVEYYHFRQYQLSVDNTATAD